MADPFIRRRTPVGSKLKVQVFKANGETFTARGKYKPPKGVGEKWNHKQLTKGRTKALRASAGQYKGSVQITFAKKTTARVRIEVIKPDGKRQGKLYNEKITKAKGKVGRVDFSVKTAKK